MTKARADDATSGAPGAAGLRGDQNRIRDAVQRNPRKMTMQLARDLGVPEVDIIRAMTPERATELDASRWEELIRGFQVFGPVRVLVSNSGATIEAVGEFDGFSTTGEFFNVQSESLDMHIRWEKLAAMFTVEKPGHMDGVSTYSFQIYDQTGAAVFKVFLNFGSAIKPAQHAQFIALRDKFKK